MIKMDQTKRIRKLVLSTSFPVDGPMSWAQSSAGNASMPRVWCGPAAGDWGRSRRCPSHRPADGWPPAAPVEVSRPGRN